MSKNHASDDVPQAADSWPNGLTAVNPVPAQRRPFDSSLAPTDVEPSADRVDPLIDRPGASTPDASTPDASTPDPADMVPADTVAADTVPADSVAADTVAADTVPADSVAADTVAADTQARTTGLINSRSLSDAAGRSRGRKPILLVAAAALCVLTVGGGIITSKGATATAAGQSSASSVAGPRALAAAGAATSPASATPGAATSPASATPGASATSPAQAEVQAKVQAAAPTQAQPEAQAQAGAQAAPLAANRSRAIPLAAAPAPAPAHRVSLAVRGQLPSTSTTRATTVGGLLAELAVTVGPADIVTPALSTPLRNGVRVRVDRVEVRLVASPVGVAEPAAVVVADPTIATGTTKIVRQGRAGRAIVVYRVTTVNGAQTAAVITSRRTIAAPVATIAHRGTKVVAPTFTYSGSQVFTNDTSFGVNWDGLAMCESTHNPRAINANPSAGLPTYGLFQFDLPTWESVGGSGNPIDASPQEQLMRAKLLYQQRGLEPWACRDAAH